MYRLDKVKADLRQQSQRLAEKKGRRSLLTQQKDEAILLRLEAEKQLGVFDLVQILLQKTSEYARQQVKTQIEEIVTSALSVVFDKQYRFWMQVEVRSNQPEVDYYLESDDVITQLRKPDYDRGGGEVDIITLALRLAIAELDGTTGTFWLDEVGKHVSADYSPNVAYFLKQYSEKFDRQIVLVTHNTHLAEIGDVSLEVSQRGGVSLVNVI